MNSARLQLVIGDITKQDTDAIVNVANYPIDLAARGGHLDNANRFEVKTFDTRREVERRRTELESGVHAHRRYSAADGAWLTTGSVS